MGFKYRVHLSRVFKPKFCLKQVANFKMLRSCQNYLSFLLYCRKRKNDSVSLCRFKIMRKSVCSASLQEALNPQKAANLALALPRESVMVLQLDDFSFPSQRPLRKVWQSSQSCRVMRLARSVAKFLVRVDAIVRRLL